jgi:hypothetical protein
MSINDWTRMKSDGTENHTVPNVSSETYIPVFLTNEISIRLRGGLWKISGNSPVSMSTIVGWGQSG